MWTKWDEVVRSFRERVPDELRDEIKASFDESRSETYPHVQIYLQGRKINTIHYEWCRKDRHIYASLHFEQSSPAANRTVLANFDADRAELESALGSPAEWGPIDGRRSDTHIAFVLPQDVDPQRAADVMLTLIAMTWPRLTRLLPRERTV